MTNTLFKEALKKGAECKRLSREEAFALAAAPQTPETLHQIGAAALENRQKRYGNAATYVFNIHINPANICVMKCSFCGYAASEKDENAYILNEQDIFSKVQLLNPTEAHIVGGLNNAWPYERNLNLVRELRKRFPDIYIKSYTAVEIDYFAQTSGNTIEQVLNQLVEAGMDSITGGGAEILSEDLHKKHWSKKAGPKRWLEIHRIAHLMNIPTNATMLFGFGETLEQRADHLLKLRQAQDETPGFVCFIPLSFQPGKGNLLKYGPTPLQNLYVLAMSRLILDNIPHIKSYWPMLGIETAAAGLSWGADDMDGTISEEKIAHFSGSQAPKGLTRDLMISTIQTAGFTPSERSGDFKLKRTSMDIFMWRN